jgi:hypothetical protein
MTKRQITVWKPASIPLYELEGKIDDAISFLQEIKKEGYDMWEADHTEGESDRFRAYYIKEESDEDYALRLKEEAEREEAAKEHRRRKYEELRKEFGPDVTGGEGG